MQQHEPPMDPSSSEATGPQLDRARAQGEAYSRALQYMVEEVAHDGGTKQAGEYTVGYAIEEAEGLYSFSDGRLTWQNPADENVHVEITVQDAADGRFIPAVTVTATLVSPSGQEMGPYEHELVWHPMLYHFARNWTVSEDGDYTLRVHIEPPAFMRHDEINGRRFTQPVDLRFDGVKIERGAEPVTPPRS
ncbi:hypothetical protein E8P82_10490 [Arthrobacter echini]|uniref:Fe2+ transport protein n=1 Tax=Arthrobacter echini TaxID=1529066 RepID=A0A4V3Z5L7_9MICC|nr:hypothetical protein [Arthrobacter echini]THJ66049.1 hypothetical protein E8P82_10490 [Arthrobacter echini]